MKAYKGFHKDMICTPGNGTAFQYKEGETYEEPKADLCEGGFHACLDPLDCLSYYTLYDSVYHEVELEGVSDQVDECGTKVCGTKIKIGKRMDAGEMIKASVNFAKEHRDEKVGEVKYVLNEKPHNQVASGASNTRIVSDGNFASLASSGYFGRIVNSGEFANLATSACSGQIANNGDFAKLASSGQSNQITNSGDFVHIVSCSDFAEIVTSGKNCVVMASGIFARVKAALGTWITLVEWAHVNMLVKPVAIVTAKVDGETVKADTWYVAKNGKLKEVPYEEQKKPKEG